MADDVPTTRKVPPLAIIIVVVIAALAAIAFANMRGATHAPHGMAGTGPAPQAADKSVMPQTSAVPNTQQPASDERGAMGHHDNPNEPGGPATTANVVGTPAR